MNDQQDFVSDETKSASNSQKHYRPVDVSTVEVPNRPKKCPKTYNPMLRHEMEMIRPGRLRIRPK